MASPEIEQTQAAEAENQTSSPIIAIIGLGEMGLAIGQALQRVKTSYTITGHDSEPDRVRAARELGAVDQGEWNLVAAAEMADLVFLTEPMEKMYSSLETIAQHMRPGTLVTDTAPLKARMLKEAGRLLPEGVSYIGGHPMLPEAAFSALQDGEDADFSSGEDPPNPFEGVTYCLTPLTTATPESMRVMSNLVATIGAEAYFVDPDEHDALIAAVQVLPYFSGLAFMDAMAASPSSRDLQRLAGQVDAGQTPLRMDALRDLHHSAMENQQPLLHWLDVMINNLEAWRARVIDPESAGLLDALRSAEERRMEWMFPDDDYPKPDWDEVEGQTLIRNLILGRIGRKPPGQE